MGNYSDKPRISYIQLPPDIICIQFYVITGRARCRVHLQMQTLYCTTTEDRGVLNAVRSPRRWSVSATLRERYKVPPSVNFKSGKGGIEGGAGDGTREQGERCVLRASRFSASSASWCYICCSGMRVHPPLRLSRPRLAHHPRSHPPHRRARAAQGAHRPRHSRRFGCSLGRVHNQVAKCAQHHNNHKHPWSAKTRGRVG
ncbi:hypothetical protein B0H16DRAFT_935001 [Mycena metata]|uniref:Uncharacterized protein n=1 Tax=Mycena metata TaxID=1033252 RepID=A0AAD7N701_9AGAR|nr:hypothetical protein B0H16DRAFT_935001 [Mycena metata]